MDRDIKVLIVEDRVDYQHIYKRIINQLGYSSMAAKSVTETQDLLNEFAFQVALIDLNLRDDVLDDRGGLEVLDLIKSTNKNIDSIILTAFGKPMDADKVLRGKYKILGFLDKSTLDTDDLAERIKTAGEKSIQQMSVKSQGNQRILIVEDSLDWRQLLSKLLKTQGYEIEIADNFETAVDKLRRDVYALAIIDIRLDSETSDRDSFTEDRKGLELFAWIQRISPATTTILCSGFDQHDQDISNAIVKYGAAHYFSKEDFNNNYFLETVAKIIQPRLYATVDLSKRGIIKQNERYQVKVVLQTQKPPRVDFIRLPVFSDTSQSIHITSTVLSSEGLEVFSPRKEVVVSDASSAELLYDLVAKNQGLQELIIEFEHQYRPIASHRMLVEVH